MDNAPNKTVRPGLPSDARLLHCYAPGEIMRDGKRAEGKEPNETRGHHDAVSQNSFLDIGTNIGIALDGQYIVVDFDTIGPLVDTARQNLPDTWCQQTLRGTHYLYRIPADWFDRATVRNTKLVVTDDEGRQHILGDIKCAGYIVAPGSLREDATGSTFVYKLLDGRDPEQAPAWLLGRCKREEELQIIVDGQTIERNRIEMGSNDSELTALAGFMRHRGFSAQAIAQMLTGVIESEILEQDAARPYTRDDAIRIARSASKWVVGSGDGSLDVRIKPDAWVCADAIELTASPIEWWLHGFIPKDQLVLLFGDGGIGKSSWVSMVAARVTALGGTFVHVGVEEPFQLFAARAALLGADRTKLYSMDSGLQLPRDAATLSEALEAGHADFLYFDSIYSHFGREEGSNAAERARTALAPLAEMAGRLGTTVLGTFHENRQGGFLGSAEMRNVCRSFLHATRDEGKPLRVSVNKTNRVLPGYALEYPGVETTWADPTTGTVQMEYDEAGVLVPMTFVLPGEPTKRARDTVNIDQIEDAREAKTEQAIQRADEARRLLAEGNTPNQIAELLRVTRRTVYSYLDSKDV